MWSSIYTNFGRLAAHSVEVLQLPVGEQRATIYQKQQDLEEYGSRDYSIDHDEHDYPWYEQHSGTDFVQIMHAGPRAWNTHPGLCCGSSWWTDSSPSLVQWIDFIAIPAIGILYAGEFSSRKRKTRVES